VLDVAELIVAQRYRLKGRVFVSWCHWDYTLAQTLGCKWPVVVSRI